MARYSLLETRTVLRMMLSAGVLAVLLVLADAGTMWVVSANDGGSHRHTDCGGGGMTCLLLVAAIVVWIAAAGGVIEL